MAPFDLNSESLTAETVIQQLGDFSHIRSPAKCAARIGQAFSDSHSSIPIDPSYVKHIAEVITGNYTFSDGVGTFSPKLWSLIRKRSKQSHYPDPTLYQIRFRGAKGMISLDSRLKGYQLCLRPSMIKYEGSQFSDIEICGSALQPLPMRLNRQHIKILEDLGVESRVFERLQEEAIQKLRAGASSSQSAITFLQSSLANGANQLPWLCKRLGDLDIDATEDAFILDILSALIQVELKELKYRARIPVEKAVTLYGIMDESKMLGERQIYCTFSKNSTKTVVCGRVAVTRSPALHPGDVQVVDAVPVPAESPLACIHNCVVFSAQGARDLPSQLSGGDLDGDLYNVIYDSDLLPKRSFPPAEYTRASSQDIGRPVTTCDMTDFFLDFMKNDQLGRIANLHQILADQLPDGTKSSECLKLAALHSTAVDFSKTGIPVDLKEIPRSPLFRPDFMAPGASTKVEKGILMRELMSQDPDETDPRGYRYYESEKVLGTLYRSIDENAFFEALEDDASSVFSKGSNCSVLEQVWRYVEMATPSVHWRTYLKAAAEIRDEYVNLIPPISAKFLHKILKANESSNKVSTATNRASSIPCLSMLSTAATI
jgi:RNA dependent RNA polymerase